jgi:predicted ATPase
MLLERGEALEALRAALGRVRGDGPGELLAVLGEAGVGKTSVLRAVMPEGPATWWGSCDPLSNPRPLAPLWDVASAAGAQLCDPADQGGVFSAVLRLLGRPVTVVLEDVQWADEATLDFLVALGRRIASSRALVVLSYRDDEIGRTHPLRHVLGELRLPEARRVRLRPLSLGAVSELAGDRGIDTARLHAVTGGNPFFVRECLSASAAASFDPATVALLGRRCRASAGRAAGNVRAGVP